MSTRPVIRPHSVVTNGDMSGSITSDVTILGLNSEFGYQAVWTGTSPVGSFAIQVSDDYTVDSAGVTQNAGTWSALPGAINFSSVSATIPVSGNSGDMKANVKIRTNAVRIVYTRVSGTGTLNVKIVGGVA